jgi:hypothetical protein
MTVLDQRRPDAPRPAMFRGGRPLKRWRYVGVFCEELMACVARVQVGPARQSFWAVLTRADGRIRERTRTGPWGSGVVELTDGRLRVGDRGVALDLVLREDPGIEARCKHGDEGGEVWTRKQAGVRAHGTLALDGGAPRSVEALAVIDDTSGYHARRTEWWWSAGVGTNADGVALAWNLVTGVNDSLDRRRAPRDGAGRVRARLVAHSRSGRLRAAVHARGRAT